MKKILFYVCIILGIAAILVTLVSSFLPENIWWLKILDFPRIQIFFSLLILIFLFALLRKGRAAWTWLFLGLLILSVVVQAYFLYSYTGIVEKKVESISEEAAPDNASFSLLIANVYMKNRNSGKFLDIVANANPDIILVMEPDEWWEEQLQPLDQEYPYSIEHPLNDTYGMLLYSKFPLSDKQIRFLQYEGVPSFHAKVKLPGGKIFRFHGVHPVPPLPKGPNQLDDKEISLKKVGEIVASQNLPAVVAGDFNDVAWPKQEVLFEHDGLLADVRIGRGFFNTFNAKNPILRWPLDYVFVTNQFAVIEMERLPEFGSDHFPLFIRLALVE